jgi:hypothetical protein
MIITWKEERNQIKNQKKNNFKNHLKSIKTQQ